MSQKKRLKAQDQGKRPLNRLEITMAEILRQNYPFSISNEAGNMWLDIVDDVAELFATDARFDGNLFTERCFGEDWNKPGIVLQSEADVTMEKAKGPQEAVLPFN